MSDSGQRQAAADRQGRAGGLAIGLGCMSLSGTYGTSDDEAGIELIHQRDRSRRRPFRQLGHVWLGPERGAARPRAEGAGATSVVIATKFGQTQNPGGANGVNGRPDYVARPATRA